MNPLLNVLNALPAGPNKFKRLFTEEKLEGEELDSAIYILCLSDAETWKDFEPKPMPLIPHGFREAYDAYRTMRKSERSEAWKSLLEEFPGYFKAIDETEAFNKSRLAFLKEMLEFLQTKGMISYADKVQRRIYEYAR